MNNQEKPESGERKKTSTSAERNVKEEENRKLIQNLMVNSNPKKHTKNFGEGGLDL